MILATHQEKELVINILISAFDPIKDDNSINLIVGHGADRLKRMNVLMSYLFDRAMRFGVIYLSDNKQACILLKFSKQEKVDFNTIKTDLSLIVHGIGSRKAIQVWRRQKIAKRIYPKENHIQPMIAGVHNGHRGRGTAARLMFQLIREHPNNNLPVIIDTVTEENVKLYQKLGFKILTRVDTLGFPIYFLRLN